MAKVVKKQTKKVAKKGVKPTVKKSNKCACKPTCKCAKPQKVSVKSVKTPVVEPVAKKTFWTKVKEFFGF